MSFILKASNSKYDKTLGSAEASEPKHQTEENKGTSYEVFKNHNTEVEVIVKEVTNKHRDKLKPKILDNYTRELQEELYNLNNDLAKTSKAFLDSKNGFLRIIFEMKKQLAYINDQEMKKQKEICDLQLENAKLKALLESKTNVVANLKKELCNMKRLLKLLMKSIDVLPSIDENVQNYSDAEFEELENSVKNNIQVSFDSKLLDSHVTFDTTNDFK